MKASGSELGWLTLPYENGVSIYTSTGIFKTSGSRLKTVFLCVRQEIKRVQLKISSREHLNSLLATIQHNRGLFLPVESSREALWDRWNEWQLDEVWQGSASLVLTLAFHKELMNAVKMSSFNLHLNLQCVSYNHTGLFLFHH